MAKIDLKMEAERFKEAKRAVQKMKRKRNTPTLQPSTHVSGMCTADLTTCEELQFDDQAKFSRRRSMDPVIGVKPVKRVHSERLRRYGHAKSLKSEGDTNMTNTGPSKKFNVSNNAAESPDGGQKSKSKVSRRERLAKAQKVTDLVLMDHVAQSKMKKNLKKKLTKRAHDSLACASGNLEVKPSKKKKKIKASSSKIADEHFLSPEGVAAAMEDPWSSVPLSVAMPLSSVKCPLLPQAPDYEDTNYENEAHFAFSIPRVKPSIKKTKQSKFRIITVDENILSDVGSSAGEKENGGGWVDASDYPTSEVQNDVTASVDFHFKDNNVILHLKHPATLYFSGVVNVTVMKGAIEILGCVLTPAHGGRSAFSPRGTCLLSLQSVEPLNEDCIASRDHLVNDGLDISQLNALFSNGSDNDAWLLLSKADTKIPPFLERYGTHHTNQLFPQPSPTERNHPFWRAGRKLQCMFSFQPGNKLYTKGEEWNDVAGSIISQGPGCSVLCGGKGVGKSTLLRFLINQILASRPKEKPGVLVLDFDPGQSELTPPGCVSLSFVQEPLLGPNYTHFQAAERCYFLGDVDVTNCASRYVEACHLLIDFWHSQPQFEGVPCLVNTMGFNKGLGVSLIAQIISMLCPSIVVQIQSKSRVRNYPDLLSVDFVKQSIANSPSFLSFKMLALRLQSEGCSNLSYDLSVLESAAEADSRGEWGLDPRSVREMSVLSYFSAAANPPNYSILDIVPYECPLESLYLCVSHEPVPLPLVLSVINASLVALCCVPPSAEDAILSSEPGMPSIILKPPFAPCLGFGIVRGIDMETKKLYLTTPLEPQKLELINCLVMGAVGIPPSVLLAPPSAPGPVPYVVVGSNQHMARSTRRSFRPLR